MSTIIRVEGGKYVEAYECEKTIDQMVDHLALGNDGLPNRAFIEATKDGVRCLVSVAHIVDIREGGA